MFLLVRIRQPSPVWRELSEYVVGAALEKLLRLPRFQLAVLLLDRRGPNLRIPSEFEVGQQLPIRRERRRILERLALGQRLRPAGAIRANLEDAFAGGRENDVFAVRAPGGSEERTSPKVKRVMVSRCVS